MKINYLFGKNKVGIKRTPEEIFNSIPVYLPDNSILQEQFKGKVAKVDIKFPQDLGEEHPFDFSETEGLYKTFGFVTGVIDKFVDFMVGPGFFVKSDNERAKVIIDQFMQDVNFDTILRAWIKEALIKGNGFLELGGDKGKVPQGLKVLNANYMYAKRDDFGVLEEYRQYRGNFSQFKMEKAIPFKPHEIAHIAFNRIGDNAYGLGIVAPAINTINNLLGNEKDMHMLIRRKANVPIHAKLGSLEHQDVPTPEAVQAFGKKLEYLTNKHEWATGPNVEFKLLDFGKIGEKFDSVLNYDLDMLFFTFQVPEVLMGRGSIPEGLADVQLEAFKMKVQSMQSEVEKVIETDIFRRVLLGNGLDVHVEFEWGEPSDKEVNEKIRAITEILKIPTLSSVLVNILEFELATLLGLDTTKLESAQEERKEEETRPQPVVPGQQKEMLPGASEVFREFTLQEWLGFNYKKYIEHIRNAIDKDEFVNLKGVTKDEIRAGKLTQGQIEKLRNVMREGFDEGKSIREIERGIKEKVNPADLYKMKDGKIETDMNGVPKLALPSDRRNILIARTETTRLANEGALSHYREGKVEKVSFLASTGVRTCPICLENNGKIMSVSEARGVIPVHENCRCTWIPITELV